MPRVKRLRPRRVSVAKTRKRTRTATRSRTRNVRRKFSAPNTGGVQWTRSKMSTGRKKSIMSQLKMNLKTSTEPVVYRVRNVKNFDNNGAYLMHKNWNATEVVYPWMVIALNSVNRPNGGPFPVRQLRQWRDGSNDGRLSWQSVAHINANNTPLTEFLDVEKGFEYNQGNLKDTLLWKHSNIKLNLWGARFKPVRYTVEIMTVTDHKLSPFNLIPGTFVGAEPQQELETMMKQYYFNPISTVNWHGSKHIKVLKRFDIIINPVESTDGDQDPKCHQLNWSTTWDRVVNYKDVMQQWNDANVAGALRNPDEGINTAFEVNEQIQSASCFPTATGIVFLSIRASDFREVIGPGPAFTNDNAGSFDVDVRNYFRADGR